ncbi:hypothetical protein LEP1GSC070_1751 [Leptospira santarosai str. AIM]|nr:hypothetical protein LEP1GSC070_1751 [Leptospira santarosai str. AIM]
MKVKNEICTRLRRFYFTSYLKNIWEWSKSVFLTRVRPKTSRFLHCFVFLYETFLFWDDLVPELRTN